MCWGGGVCKRVCVCACMCACVRACECTKSRRDGLRRLRLTALVRACFQQLPKHEVHARMHRCM
jgi:hypothetical protein